MRLADGSNTISDELFEAARREMSERHSDEYETVHDGSGRSEEMPSELDQRHQDEREALHADRDRMGIAEWMTSYPAPVLERTALERTTIDDPVRALSPAEIVGGLWQAARGPTPTESPTEALHLTREELAAVQAMISVAVGVPLRASVEGQLFEKVASASQRLQDRLSLRETPREAEAPRVIAERGSEAWNAAWRGLGETIAREGIGTGKDLAQFNDKSASYEDWQYMGSSITPAGMSHDFRHRDHPATGQSERREVVTDHLNTISASLKIERTAEESGLAPRQRNGQLQLWAEAIVNRVNSLRPDRQVDQEIDAPRPRHVQRP